MQCTEEEKYHLAIFTLQGDVHIWWKLVQRNYQTNNLRLNSAVYKEEVNQKYIPDMIRDRKATKFTHLVKGQMTVLEYEAKFANLARYAPQMIATPREKARKFQEGIAPWIKSRMTMGVPSKERW